MGLDGTMREGSPEAGRTQEQTERGELRMPQKCRELRGDERKVEWWKVIETEEEPK